MRRFAIPRWRFTSCCGHGSTVVGPTRRRFLAGAVAGATTLATMRARAGAQVRVFPPAPPAVSPIEGLIDFHVHSAPDVFGRSLDDDQVAQLYRDNGMEAVVLKSHVALTADRAWLVRKHVPGLTVFGGIALNAAAGGINPDAVQWMWRMQGSHGRVVWFPTFDADHHVKHFKDAPEGIRVVTPDGGVLPQVREVLKICAQQKLVVCTGHSSPAEALAIVEAAREAGCDRLLITHAEFEVVNMSADEMKRAAALGATLELCAMGPLMGPNAHLAWMRHWRQVTAKETAEHIRTVGARHFLLSTDLGQSGNPSPPDGFKLFVAALMAEGVTRDEIGVMGREVPGRLLMG